ncbi:uncharacterized protein WM294_005417 [Sarcoramphus papa]
MAPPALLSPYRPPQQPRCSVPGGGKRNLAVPQSFLSFPFFFFFLKAQPQHCTQQKPSACSSPHPSTGPKNNLLPPPKSRQLRAHCRLKKEATKLLRLFLSAFASPIRPASATSPLLRSPAHCQEPPTARAQAKTTRGAEKAPELVSTTFQAWEIKRLTAMLTVIASAGGN